MGVIDYILWPFGWVLRTSYNLTGSYFAALFIFALLMKVVLLPFSVKQQKNSIKQAKLAPKEAAIRKKYAGRNDQVTQQKMAQEIQAMQNAEGFNPLSGCLPLLIQMPIIMILYKIVYMPLTYISQFSADTISAMKAVVEASVENFTWKQQELQLLQQVKALGADKFASVEGFDASALPRLNLFGIESLDLTDIPSLSNLSNWLWVIPVLVFLTTFLSMKVMKKFTYQNPMMQQNQGCSGGIMDISMPAVSFAFSFSFSAAIGVYWIFQSVLGLVQQIILAKLMPFPKYTEDDFKAAEKEMGVKDREEKKQQKQKVRSLHHIDDDEEDLPPRASRPAGTHVPEDEEPASLPDNGQSVVEKAPLKDDSDRV